MSASFKNLIDKKKQLILIGVAEPIEALIAEDMGFEAVYISGAVLSASLGVLDEGLITPGKLIEKVKDIRKVSDIPLLVDCDTGFWLKRAHRCQSCRGFERDDLQGASIYQRGCGRNFSGSTRVF